MLSEQMRTPVEIEVWTKPIMTLPQSWYEARVEQIGKLEAVARAAVELWEPDYSMWLADELENLSPHGKLLFEALKEAKGLY